MLVLLQKGPKHLIELKCWLNLANQAICLLPLTKKKRLLKAAMLAQAAENDLEASAIMPAVTS